MRLGIASFFGLYCEQKIANNVYTTSRKNAKKMSHFISKH